MILKVLIVVLAILLALAALIYLVLFKDKSKKRQKHEFDPDFEAKRAETFPPPFPNGWFNLCSSDSIKKGEVKEITAFGQKLAVFRAENGEVGVVDAYCPHLGANLSDGKVEDNTLVCPFHAWNFNTKGKCVHIPYSDNGHNQEHTNANCWTVKENWGLILVWYHSEGKAPTWDTEGYLEELKSYKYYGSTKETLRIHLQDFSENGADYAHFNVVHDLLTIPFANKFVHVTHKTHIEFGEGEEKHMAYFYDHAQIARNKDNSLIENAGGKAKVTYFGPGFLVFAFDTRFGCPMIVKTFTPIGTLKVRMEDHIYAPRNNFSLAVKYIVGEAAVQFHDDINIWERKTFARKPMLVKGDGPIMKMRKWYSQFYSEENAFSEADDEKEPLYQEVQSN
ncbi:MAG: Rieske 2Fe-2S domain-containing protein [Chitinophagales bacterium]